MGRSQNTFDPAGGAPSLKMVAVELHHERVHAGSRFSGELRTRLHRLADPQADKVLIGAYTKCCEDIRQYLLQQAPRELAGGKFDRYMDLLEKTIRPVPGCTVQEARWLYESYWTKGTAKSVGQLRRQYDKTDD